METPDTIDLRKRTGIETPDESAGPPRELFHVLQERKADKSEGSIFNTENVYILPGTLTLLNILQLRNVVLVLFYECEQ